MSPLSSPLGQVIIGTEDDLFAWSADRIGNAVQASIAPPSIALTGGSTPKAFYRWLASQANLFAPIAQSAIWTVSDERCVPEDHPDSNFGTASRLLLDPLQVPDDARLPWDTSRDPQDAAEWYAQLWAYSFGESRTYNLCFLGMGTDGHTASLFPNSPLLASETQGHALFAAVEVPTTGWRLTLTRRGICLCDHLVVSVTGTAKADALLRVFSNPHGPVEECPIRLLAEVSDKVTWLIDQEAFRGIQHLLSPVIS